MLSCLPLLRWVLKVLSPGSWLPKAFSYTKDAPEETMKELPSYTIPAVLSFLDAKNICRCACVAKDWAACLQLDPIANKVQPIRAREQITEEEKTKIDKDMIKAAMCGNLEGVRDLIGKGASLEARNTWSLTPLMSAAMFGYTEVVEVLLCKGAKTDTVSRSGWTPLIFAATGGHTSSVLYLISSGACLNIKNCEGNTALDCAEKHGYSDIAKILRESGGQKPALRF